MRLLLQAVLAVVAAFLLQAVLATNNHALGRLVLRTRTPAQLTGRFTTTLAEGGGSDPVSLGFFVQPSSFTLTDARTGAMVFSLLDYGSFTQVTLWPDHKFLIASNTSAPVLDLALLQAHEPSRFALLAVDAAVQQPLGAHQHEYDEFASWLSPSEVASSEQRLLTLLQAFRGTHYAAALVHLSVALALDGVSTPDFPSATPLHLTAMRVAKLRPDVRVDPMDVQHANALVLHGYQNASLLPQEAGCSLTDTCDNPCFGMCGPDWQCWSWVCGTCDCYLGCWQHDCCCSCRGILTPCCLDVFSVHCDGYNNDCKPGVP